LLHFQNDNIVMHQRRIDVPVPINYHRLHILPINDVELLKEFDRNLVKRDPVNADLQMQFVRHFFIISNNFS